MPRRRFSPEGRRVSFPSVGVPGENREVEGGSGERNSLDVTNMATSPITMTTYSAAIVQKLWNYCNVLENRGRCHMCHLSRRMPEAPSEQARERSRASAPFPFHCARADRGSRLPILVRAPAPHLDVHGAVESEER